MNERVGDEILHLDRITRSFGEVVAVDGLSLSVGNGELVTLLGPSGCGKTTVLRLIAGFELPDRGQVFFHGRDITSRKPQERGFGMVFQSYALFPHLNVFENVAFGLRARKLSDARIRERVASALDLVDMAGFGDRAVQALSGGQQQRVALARAIATEPPLLLLDEPLSNLDQALRVRTRTELRSLVRELGITAIFVTHDQEEAFDLSDRIVVMRSGTIVQIGSPWELYDDPADRFVAGFVGRTSALQVTVEATGIRLAEEVVWPIPSRGSESSARTSPGREGDQVTVRPGSAAVLVFRPEGVRFVHGDAEPSLGAPLRGIVRDRRFRGGATLFHVEVEAGAVGAAGREAAGRAVVEVLGPSSGPDPGAEVRIQPNPGARLHLFAEGPA
jgi:ABC-type Fe3+/spermidine/putrescine transport system ATPase subunit